MVILLVRKMFNGYFRGLKEKLIHVSMITKFICF